MNRNILAGLACAVVAGYAANASAAELMNEDGTINSCISKKTGRLKVIGTTDSCKPDELLTRLATEISVGPQGETGPVGPQGETGPVGPQGEPGTSWGSASPVVIDGEGNELGVYTGIDNDSSPNGGNHFYTEILSDMDYRFVVKESTGKMRSHHEGNKADQGRLLYFSNSRCQGQAYIGIDQPEYRDGFVLMDGKTVSDWWYIPKGSVVIEGLIRTESYLKGSSCVDGGYGKLDYFVPVYANDPAITGVPNMGSPDNSFPLPITIERP